MGGNETINIKGFSKIHREISGWISGKSHITLLFSDNQFSNEMLLSPTGR